MNFNKFNKLKQWSKSHKLATAGALAAFLLIAGYGAAVIVAANRPLSEGSCPRYDPPDGVMAPGEQALSCENPRCSAVEIRDAEVAAAGKAGSNAGFAGAWYGCVPVCVWHNDGDLLVQLDEVKFYRRIPDSIEIDSSGVIAPHRNYLFRDERRVFDGVFDGAFGGAFGGAEVTFADDLAKVYGISARPSRQDCLGPDWLAQQRSEIARRQAETPEQ